MGERQGENKNGHANQSCIFILDSCFLRVPSSPQCESLKVVLKIEQGKKGPCKEPELGGAGAGREGKRGWGGREREISGLCFLSQAMT